MNGRMIVVDANVLVSALKSRNGASNRLLQDMILGAVRFAISPSIVLEYEDVLKRGTILGLEPWITEAEIDAVLDALCGQAALVSPEFRFRPFLDDPKDDMYVECALAASARIIVSRDRHFRHRAMGAFGLSAMTPAEYVEASRRGER